MSDRSAPTVRLLCGLPGSGKTTRAAELQAAGKGIALNADSWVWRLYPDDAEAAARDERKALVESLQWDVAALLLGRGIDVILDWGVWTRAHRDECRRRAVAANAAFEIVFLDEPLSTLHARVADRNRDLPPGTFAITADELDEWAATFEPPTTDELTPVRPQQ